VLWLLLSIALTLASTAGFALVYVAAHGGIVRQLDGSPALLALLVVALLTRRVMALHGLTHRLAMRHFGASPTYGAEVAGLMEAVLYGTAVGNRFTRRAYVAIALAPLVTLSRVGVVLITLLPVGGWLVLPLGFHAGGKIGDLWVSWLTVRRPPGTLVEDRRSGACFSYPLPPPHDVMVPVAMGGVARGLGDDH
jgi:hypothetical protein